MEESSHREDHLPAGGRMSRRQTLFALGGGLAGAALLATGIQVAVGPSAVQRAMAKLKLARFVPLLGSRFRVQSGPRRWIDLTLVEAVDLAAGTAQGECFSLLFRGAQPDGLEQATYPFWHPAQGMLDLFVVPVALEENTWFYEAVVNHQTV